VTRDRVSATRDVGEKTFEVVDTGGIAFMDEEKTQDMLAGATRQQAEVAIEMADALVLVVDVMAGVTPLDLEIARKLRASGKPIFLAVNKSTTRNACRRCRSFRTGFGEDVSHRRDSRAGRAGVIGCGYGGFSDRQVGRAGDPHRHRRTTERGNPRW